MNSKAIRSVIMLVLIAVIFMYLQKMEHCECVDKGLVQRLKTTEMGIGALIAFNLAANLATDGKFTMISKNKIVTATIMTAIIALFGYLVYLVYNYNIDAKGCECAEKKARYALYLQGGYYAILLALLFVLLIVLSLVK
jgi:hypothetical protein